MMKLTRDCWQNYSTYSTNCLFICSFLLFSPFIHSLVRLPVKVSRSMSFWPLVLLLVCIYRVLVCWFFRTFVCFSFYPPAAAEEAADISVTRHLSGSWSLSLVQNFSAICWIYEQVTRVTTSICDQLKETSLS